MFFVGVSLPAPVLCPAAAFTSTGVFLTSMSPLPPIDSLISGERIARAASPGPLLSVVSLGSPNAWSNNFLAKSSFANQSSQLDFPGFKSLPVST